MVPPVESGAEYGPPLPPSTGTATGGATNANATGGATTAAGGIDANDLFGTMRLAARGGQTEQRLAAEWLGATAVDAYGADAVCVRFGDRNFRHLVESVDPYTGLCVVEALRRLLLQPTQFACQLATYLSRMLRHINASVVAQAAMAWRSLIENEPVVNAQRFVRHDGLKCLTAALKTHASARSGAGGEGGGAGQQDAGGKAGKGAPLRIGVGVAERARQLTQPGALMDPANANAATVLRDFCLLLGTFGALVGLAVVQLEPVPRMALRNVLVDVGVVDEDSAAGDTQRFGVRAMRLLPPDHISDRDRTLMEAALQCDLADAQGVVATEARAPLERCLWSAEACIARLGVDTVSQSVRAEVRRLSAYSAALDEDFERTLDDARAVLDVYPELIDVLALQCRVYATLEQVPHALRALQSVRALLARDYASAFVQSGAPPAQPQLQGEQAAGTTPGVPAAVDRLEASLRSAMLGKSAFTRFLQSLPGTLSMLALASVVVPRPVQPPLPPAQQQQQQQQQQQLVESVTLAMGVGGAMTTIVDTDCVIEIDPLENICASLKNDPRMSPLARFGHSIVSFDGNLVMFGGRMAAFADDLAASPMDPQEMLWVYNVSRREWIRPPQSGPMPSARYNHACTVVNGVMYVLGGERTSENVIDDDPYLHALDLRTFKWHVHPHPFVFAYAARSGVRVPPSTVALVRLPRGLVGVVWSLPHASDANVNRFASCYVFDPAAGRWLDQRVMANSASLTRRIGGFSLLNIDDDYAVLYGGTAYSSDTSATETVAVHDLRLLHLPTLTWSTEVELFVPPSSNGAIVGSRVTRPATDPVWTRSMHGAAIVDGRRLVVAAGDSPHFGSMSDVFEVSLDSPVRCFAVEVGRRVAQRQQLRAVASAVVAGASPAATASGAAGSASGAASPASGADSSGGDASDTSRAARRRRALEERKQQGKGASSKR